MTDPTLSSIQRPSRGEKSRARILEEATRLFGLYGYSSVTMREIGAAADLDNSTIYRYFKGKQELAGAVAQSVLTELAPVIVRLDLSREPSLEQLVDTVMALYRLLCEKPSIARLLLAWMSTTGEERSGFSHSVNLSESPDHPAAQTVRMVVEWFEAAERHGSIRPVSPVDAIVNLSALVIVRPATAGHFLHSLDTQTSRQDRRHAAEQELAAGIRGLFSPIKGGRT